MEKLLYFLANSSKNGNGSMYKTAVVLIFGFNGRNMHIIIFFFRNRNGNTLRCGDDTATNNPTPTTYAGQNGKVNSEWCY